MQHLIEPYNLTKSQKRRGEKEKQGYKRNVKKIKENQSGAKTMPIDPCQMII